MTLFRGARLPYRARLIIGITWGIARRRLAVSGIGDSPRQVLRGAKISNLQSCQQRQTDQANNYIYSIMANESACAAPTESQKYLSTRGGDYDVRLVDMYCALTPC
jgi:hypothetical protein